MANNTSGITPNSGNNNINQFSSAAMPNTQEKVNFNFANVVKDEVRSTQEEALNNVLSGAPTPDLTVAETTQQYTPQLTIDSHEVTDKFTTRQEVMSQLHLMDENGNYTDTYTNYVNNGGQPLPGYEQAHQEILNQERYEKNFERYNNGEISYEDALMQSYGTDILESMGYKVKSVGWWMSKYLSHDYSNPSDNRYIMDQVLREAQNYHESRLASEWANKDTKDTQLATLVGQDLEYTQIKDLFDLKNISDELDDKDFMRALHTGSISAQMRMTQDADGNWYYLHTDGELYKLDGQSGENHGTLKTDANGNFIGIDLNNSAVGTTARSLWTGFEGVFHGIVDLGITAVNTIDALVPVFSCWSGDFGVWDGVESEDFIGWTNTYDAWLNDNASWLVDNGYVDLDTEHISGQDAANFIASMIGTIAGTMTLAGAIGSVGDGVSAGKGLTGWGQSLIKEGHTIAGNIVKGTGTVLRWQTGNLGTNYGTVAHTGTEAAKKAVLQVWGRRAGGAAVANTKNFINDWRKMYVQSKLYEDGATEGEIMARAFTVNIANTLIDTFISGGMDDNQWQAWSGRDTFIDYNSAEYKSAKNALTRALAKGTSREAKKALSSVESKAVKQFFLQRGLVIAHNSGMDFIGNLATGALQSYDTLDENGKLTEKKLSNIPKYMLSGENLAKSAITTAWYSTRGQIKEWNTGLEVVGSAHQGILDDFDTLIKETKDADTKLTYSKIKADYIKALDESKQPTREGKILDAMSTLTKNLGDKEVPKIIRDNVMKQATIKNKDMYDALWKNAQIMYGAQVAKHEYILSPKVTESKLVFKDMFKHVGNLYDKLVGLKGRDDNYTKQRMGDAMFDQQVSESYKSLFVNNYDIIDNLQKDIEERQKGKVTTQDPLLTQTGYTLSKKNKKVFDKISKNDPDAMNKNYFILPNNVEVTDEYKSTEVALNVMTQLGYIKTVDQDNGVYEIQNYTDGTDFVNTSLINSQIYLSVKDFALMKGDASEEANKMRADIINNLMSVLTNNKADINSKTEVFSQLLYTMCDPNQKDKSKNVLTVDQAHTLIKELQNKNSIYKFTNNKFKNQTADEATRFFYAYGEVLTKLIKNKGEQIDISDPINRKVLDTMVKEGKVTKKSYENLLKVQETNQDFFDNGNPLNKKTAFVQKQLERMFSGMDSQNKYSKEEIQEQIKLYFSVNTGEDIDKTHELYDHINALAQAYDDIYKNTKTVTLEDSDMIYINLANFQGKQTTSMLKDLLTQTELKNLDQNDTIALRKFSKRWESDVNKELEFARTVKASSGNVLAFNIKTETSDLIKFLNGFGYDVNPTSTPDALRKTISMIGQTSLKNYRGDLIVLDVPKGDTEAIKEVLNNKSVKLKVNNETKEFNLINRTVKDINGFEIGSVDYYKAIMDNVEIHNIDPSLQFQLNALPILQIMPFEPNANGRYVFSEPIEVALLSNGSRNLRKLSGKAASQTEQAFTAVFSHEAGTEVKIDKNLESYFILDMIATRLTDEHRMTLPINKEEAAILKANGLVDYYKTSSKKPTDTKGVFWEISKGGTLQLKPGVTADTLRNYIVSKDFNFFKMFPLLLTDSDQAHGMLTAYETVSTSSDGQLPKGMNQENFKKLLKFDLPWDDEENTRFRQFLYDIKDASANTDELYFNPFDGEVNYTIDKSEYKSFDDWNKATKDSTNPYDILLHRYYEEFQKMIKGEEGQTKYNNETLILKNKKAQQTLVDAVNNDIKPSEELVNKIKEDMNFRFTPDGETQSITPYTESSGVYSRSPRSSDSMLIDRTGANLGGLHNMHITSADGSYDWIDLQTVTDAYNTAKDIMVNADNEYKLAYNSNYSLIDFKEDPVTKLFQLGGESEGNIAVQDIDEWSDALFENSDKLRDFFSSEALDRQAQEPQRIISDEAHAAMKYMFGKNAEQTENAIFEEAKKYWRLQSKMPAVTERKATIKYDAPSITQDITGADGITPKSNRATEKDTNLNNFFNLVQNSLNNKDLNNQDKFFRISDSSQRIVDNELDDLQQRIESDRLLTTSSPMDSISGNLSLRNNQIGLMHTTINTYQKLLDNFDMSKINPEDREKVQQNLMDAATTFTNSHVGVDYAGETMDFFILDKQGKNLDIKDLGAANYQDLLYNISKYKKSLIGNTIVRVHTQGIENTAALQMEQIKLTKNNLSDFVTDLWANVVYTNQKAWERNHKNGIEEYMDHLVTNMPKGADLQDALEMIPATRYSSIQKTKNEYEIFKSRTNLSNKFTYEQFVAIVKGINTLDLLPHVQQAFSQNIQDTTNVVDEAFKNNFSFKQVVDLSLGISPDALGSDVQNELNKVRESFATNISGLNKLDTDELLETIETDEANREEIQRAYKALQDSNVYNREDIKQAINEIVAIQKKKNRELTQQEKAKIIISNVIKSKNDSPTIDYLVRNRSLVDMMESEKSSNIKDGFYVDSDNGKPIPLDTFELKSLVDSIKNNTDNTSKYSRIIAFDTETDLKNKGDVFSIGIYMREFKDGKWVDSHYNIYIDKSSINANNTTKQKLIDTWLRENSPEDDSFIKTNEGYRKERDNFKNIISLNNDTDMLFLRPDKAKEFIENLFGTKEDTILLGYNSAEADLKWLQNSGILSKDIRDKVTHIDEMLLLHASQNINTKPSSGLDNIAERFGISTAGAHGSVQDAQTTMRLFDKAIDYSYNINSMRNYVYRDIDNVLKAYFKDSYDEVVNSQAFIKTLEEIDAAIQDARSKTNIGKYFDANYTLNPNDVVSATDLLEYVVNKKLNDYVTELSKQELKDVALDNIATEYLNTEAFKRMGKVWTFAKSQGVTEETFLKTLDDCVGPLKNFNTLLHTMSSEQGIDSMITKLGLNAEEFDEANTDYTEIFGIGVDPNNAKFISQDTKDNYKNFGNYSKEIKAFRTIIDALNISDDMLLNDLITDMGTFYDINENSSYEDVMDYFKNDAQILKTRGFILWKDYMDSKFGDADALFQTSKLGVYDLIDSLDMNETIHDMLTNSDVKGQAQDVVISRSMFESLVHMSVEDYIKKHKEAIEANGGVYSQFLVHPGDNNFKTIPRRIRVIDTDENFMRAPETVLETLGARDLDGDHLTLLSPDDYSQNLLATYSNEIFKTHDMQETVLAKMRELGLYSGDTNEDVKLIHYVGKDEAVLDACRAADIALQKNDEEALKEAKKAFDKALKNLYPDINTDDAKDFKKSIYNKLWIKEVDSYEETKDAKTKYRFIQNPSIYWDNDKLSYSGETRLKLEGLGLINKSYFAFADQSSGMVQKYMPQVFNANTIKNPWTDVLISNIYGSEVIYKMWKNIDPSDTTTIDTITNTLKDSLLNFYPDQSNSKVAKKIEVLDKDIDRINDFLKAGENTKAFNMYSDLLFNTEKELRNNLDPKQLMSALTTDEMLDHYNNMNERIQNIRKAAQLRNELYEHNNILPNDYDSEDSTMFMIKNNLDDLSRSTTKEYNQDIYGEQPDTKVFIITRGDTSGIGSDTILYNKDTSDKRSVFTKTTLTVGKDDELENLHITRKFKDKKSNTYIERPIIYKKGTVILRNKYNSNDVQKLEQDSIIVGKQGNKLITISITPFDSQVKGATDTGAKGVINSSYGIVTDGYDDVSFLIHNISSNKSLGNNAKQINPEEQKIQIKTADGTVKTVYGYVQEGVKFKTVENTKAWAKSKDRKIDFLHLVSDAYSINGLLNGQVFYDEDNNSLTVDPSYIKEGTNSIFKKYKYIQDHNRLPLFNKLKLSYILSHISDDELLSAFNTDMEPQELRDNLLNKNIALGTSKYTSIAQVLGNKFKSADWFDNENPVIKALFDDASWTKLNSIIQTASSDFKVYEGTSKQKLFNQGSDAMYSVGDAIQFTKDELDTLNDFTSWETGGYLSSTKFYNLLLGKNGNPFNTFQLIKLMQEHKLPVGTFKDGTASMYNGFRNANVDYITDKILPGGSLGSGLSKTANTGSRAIPTSANYLDVDLEVPKANEIVKETSTSLMDPGLLHMILSDEYISQDKLMRTALMYKALESQNKSDTLAQKLEKLTNESNTWKLKDMHYALVPDENGSFKLMIDNMSDKIGTLRELRKDANKSLYNYSTWKATNSDNEVKTISNAFLEDNVKKAKARELLSAFNRGQQQTKNALDSLEINLKNDFFNKKTGEISKVRNIAGYDTNTDIVVPKVLSGGNESVIKESVWGRQGLDENDPFNAQLSTAMKRVSASQIASEQELLFKFDNLIKIRNQQLSMSEYKQYNTYRAIWSEYNDPSYRQLAEQHMEYFGIESIKDVSNYLNNFRMIHIDIENAYNSFEQSMTDLANAVREETGEPVSTIGFLMCPYKNTKPEQNKQQVYSVLHKIYNQYDPISKPGQGALSSVYDFDNSMKSIIKELSAMHASRYMSEELKANNLLDNKALINEVTKTLSDTISKITQEEEPGTKDYKSKLYIREDDSEQGQRNKEIKQHVFDFVSQLTGMTIDETHYGSTTTDQYKSLFDNISYRLSGMMDSFNKKYNTDLEEYTDFYMLQYASNKPYELKHEAKVIADFYYAKMVCMQGMLDSSYRLSESLKDTMNNLSKNGYCFVNKYGQKYTMNGIVAPLSSTSLGFLKENMGIAYNSNNETMWNQFLMQKVMSGELYLMKQDVADYLEKHQYTHKVGSQTMQTLKKISKWSAALQMALPSKILNRVISFTGFDYSMGALYNPHVLEYIGPARRELLAAYQSKGTQMSDELREYMIREGQPIGLTGKDPVTFSESMDASTKAGKAVEAVLDKLTDPLEFQNHLGRYAIYRAALKSFEDGDPWYGPFYSKKDAIDSLRTNEDKAMYIMDYVLGSPGGFPELARKTSGVMMYATFPMNFSRTLGAWGMSMAKLFQEGVTAENSKYWMQTAFVPSVGAASLTGFVMLLNSWICDLLGVDEKGKEDIVKSLQTLDPVGTIIGGTPTKSSSSMNPVSNAKEMFVDPLTSEYNDNIFKKIYGLVNTNIISHFNPAIKTPLELITGYDLFGASPVNTKYQYTTVENGERKVLGFLIGSNIANNVITQNKIDKYSTDSNFMSSFLKGAVKGVQESIGNQKTYKKDTSNYYNQISAANSYKYKTSDTYDTDWEDYTNADDMELIRNSSSKYGQFNSDDYQRISKLMKKMMKDKEEPATVYSLIAKEYQNGVSEVTLKAVLNNNSIVRKLKQIDVNAYLNTLTSRQYKELMKAVEYENTFYPMLQEFFPTKDTTKKYNKTYYHKDYIPYISSSSYVSRPKSYYPSYSSNYSYKKTYYNKYKNNYKFDNNTKVSPQMGIWDNNYNKIEDLKVPNLGGGN